MQINQVRGSGWKLSARPLFVLVFVFIATCAQLGRAQDVSRWYEFAPKNTVEPGEIGMLQDLQIRQVVNILRHRNPYTALTYANDPAIFVVELFNEDSALWFGVMPKLQSVPTLRKQISERFSDWLKAKYGSHAGLIKAWGQGAIDSFKNEGFVGEHRHTSD